MPAYDEELFGPVAAIIPVRDEAEALAVANDSIYGLGAAIFTKNKKLATTLARQLEAGVVFINDFVRSDPALPFGGVKQSGYGRELGPHGIREFVNVKTVVEA
jgi:succinate-semialdehyde dehydrogenase/glutarate-semialdehyde dehydrogenase